MLKNKKNLLYIKEESQYLNILINSFDKGALNWLGQEEPIFESIDEFLECYDIPGNLLDELQDFPEFYEKSCDELLIKCIRFRMKSQHLNYPFYLIIEKKDNYYIQEYQNKREQL